jgi:hypothetical protein
VGQGVGGEVGQHLAEATLVAHHHQRPVGDVDHHRPVGLDGPGVGGGVGGQAGEVDVVPGEGPVLVQLGQVEEVVDDPRHADRLLLGAALGVVEPAGVAQAAGAVQLGVAPDRGDRRVELVGGVGHELAQAGLRAGALGEGALDLGQHLVEGGAQAAGLGAGIGLGHPVGQVAGGDRGGRGGHLVHRAHAQVDHPPGDEPQRQRHDRAAERAPDQQRGGGVVDGVERQGQHDRLVRPGVVVGERPVALVAVGGAGGERRAVLGAVAGPAGVDGRQGVAGTVQVGLDLGGHPVAVDHPDVERAEGHLVAARRAARLGRRVVEVEPHVADGGDGAGQLVVDLVDHPGAGGREDDEAEGGEHDRHEGGAGQDAGPQGHRVRLSRTAGCSPPPGRCG